MELIKSEVEKVLTAIGVDDCMEKVKVTRFNDSGPILLVCENKGTKIKIIKAASKLTMGSLVCSSIMTGR